MSDEFLMLTSYFGERQRTPNGLFVDAQLDVFDRHEVATSILLRGVSGFGLKHHFRSDGPPTLSGDLPLVSVAVDTRRKIEGLVDELAQLGHRGLVTLERTRLLGGDTDRVAIPNATREAVKLTIYLGRREQVYRVPAFAAVCELLHRRGVDAAIVLLGVDGTGRGRRSRARFFGANSEVPVMIVAVGSGDRIARVIPELGGLLHHPMMSVEQIQVCKRDGELIEYPRSVPSLDGNSVPGWLKLAVYSSAGTVYEGEAMHRALVRRLRGCEARGATVMSGIWGFHDDQPPHGDQIWPPGRDAPMCTIIIDAPHRLSRSFDVVDEVTAEQGVVTVETVPALVQSTGGPASPPTLTPQNSHRCRPMAGQPVPGHSRSIARRIS